MKADAAMHAASLIRQCRTAALGTIHDGAPLVSMTPYAVLPAPFAFVLLTSGLAAHTRDMLADPRVGLLVMAAEQPGAPVHALARVAIQGVAQPLAADNVDDYRAARAAYTARFPDMTGLFDLADFGLFVIRPATVRVVAGFAQAQSITPQSLAAAVLGGPVT